MVETRTRIWEKFKYDVESDTYYYERTTETLSFNATLREWKITKSDVEKIPIETKGVTKSAKMRLIIVRETTDRESLKTIKGYFVQEIEARVPDLEEFKHTYVSIDNKKLWLHVLNEGMTQEITLTTEPLLKSWISNLVKRIGEPKRLTEKETLALIKLPDVHKCLYSEDSEGYLSLAPIYSIKI